MRRCCDAISNSKSDRCATRSRCRPRSRCGGWPGGRQALNGGRYSSAWLEGGAGSVVPCSAPSATRLAGAFKLPASLASARNSSPPRHRSIHCSSPRACLPTCLPACPPARPPVDRFRGPAAAGQYPRLRPCEPPLTLASRASRPRPLPTSNGSTSSEAASSTTPPASCPPAFTLQPRCGQRIGRSGQPGDAHFILGPWRRSCITSSWGDRAAAPPLLHRHHVPTTGGGGLCGR
jgi:hypothetical protein